MFPQYRWLYLIVDSDKNCRYESLESYRTEREAIHAVFELMNQLIEEEILQDTAKPLCN
jgi:hypothetical protein